MNKQLVHFDGFFLPSFKKKLNLRSKSNEQIAFEILDNLDEYLSVIRGEFSFSIKNGNEFFAIRDQLGIVPLYYYHNKDVFYVHSDPDWILKQPDVQFELNEIWPAKYLLNIQNDYTETSNKFLKRLPNASYLIFKNGKISINQYWKPDFDKRLKLKSKNECINLFEQELQRSIKDRVDNHSRIGCEVSGGLDSSLVVSLTSKLFSKTHEIHTFSESYPKDSKIDLSNFLNERNDCESVLANLKVNQSHFVDNSNKSLNDFFLLTNKVHFEPPFRTINIFSSGHMEKARELGVTKILSGFGGDEITSSPVTPDLLFLLKHQLFNEVIDFLKPQDGISDLFRNLRKGIQPRYKRKPEMEKRILDKWGYYQINKQLPYYRELKQQFLKKAQFTFSSDYYEQFSEKIFGPARLPYRLSYFHQMAKHFQTSYSYPLLDVDLIQLYLTLPISMRGDYKVKRKLFRELLKKNGIPNKIFDKQSKRGASSPSHIFLKLRDQRKMINEYLDKRKPSHLDEIVDIEKILKNPMGTSDNTKILEILLLEQKKGLYK